MSARREIERELLAWMASWRGPALADAGAREASRAEEGRFQDLALRLFRFQVAHCEAYARFCAARGATPEGVTSWRAIPPVPTGAFKELPLRCFPEADTRAVFRTSGTSGERRGELHLDSLAIYEASLWPTLRHLLLPDLPEGRRLRMRVLAPSPRELPDSSLSHMFGALLARAGDAESGFDVRDGELDVAGLDDALERACDAGVPVALLGTAFAFVHWLERSRASRALPAGSRVMETGGFKGRARELSRVELHAALASHTGLPVVRIVNQYGMTELGSQFYDSVIADPGGPRRKLGPPWARVRIVDPVTLVDRPVGEVGTLVIHDLANTGSVAAIQTADVGRRVADGFEVLGREPGAEARGCSLAADLMLGSGD